MSSTFDHSIKAEVKTQKEKNMQKEQQKKLLSRQLLVLRTCFIIGGSILILIAHSIRKREQLFSKGPLKMVLLFHINRKVFAPIY